MPDQAAPDGLDNPFWTFSLRLYGQDGVPERLLRLQDTLSLDVNLLLFSAFSALRRGEAVTQADASAWDDAVQLWREEVVEPLRQLRRSLKIGPGSMDTALRGVVRKEIAAVELLSEQVEQAELYERFAAGSAVRSPSDPHQAVVAAMLAVLGLWSREDVDDAAVLEAVRFVAGKAVSVS